MVKLRDRIRKLETGRTVARPVAIFVEMGETKEEAAARYQQANPDVTLDMDQVIFFSWSIIKKEAGHATA